jgi:excisionase family DNA binding protein
MAITVGNMKLYDVEDLSDMLKLQDRTVRKLLREGTLPGKKLARKWYVSEDALKEYFKAGPMDIRFNVTQK